MFGVYFWGPLARYIKKTCRISRNSTIYQEISSFIEKNLNISRNGPSSLLLKLVSPPPQLGFHPPNPSGIG
jgi:hypothetical protein